MAGGVSRNRGEGGGVGRPDPQALKGERPQNLQ